MNFRIANVRSGELGEVLRLNEAEVPHVGQVDLDQLKWFAANAAYFRVARDDASLAAFLIGMRPGTSYQSSNYRWFCERYDDFAYIDRVAVAPAYRRHGLASRLYDDFAASVPATVPVMTCEVNIRPPNQDSMRFHEQLGFVEVGRQTTEHGSKEVALLARAMIGLP